MTDTIRVTVDQIDEDTGKEISHLKYETYELDRDTANAGSLSLTQGLKDVVAAWADFKAKGGKPV